MNDPELDAPPAEPSTGPPPDAADRVRDAEDALRAFYNRVDEAERELRAAKQRAAEAEAKTAQVESQVAALTQQLDTTQDVRDSERLLRTRVAELDDQIARAHEEIHALHNSRTMRLVALPRRVYANLRALGTSPS